MGNTKCEILTQLHAIYFVFILTQFLLLFCILTERHFVLTLETLAMWVTL